jgi:hypothetical protein
MPIPTPAEVRAASLALNRPHGGLQPSDHSGLVDLDLTTDE